MIAILSCLIALQSSMIVDICSTQATDITICSDVIITKYKTVKGKRLKRRWNKTKNKWVDSKWHE